jgi:hypothetical protein
MQYKDIYKAYYLSAKYVNSIIDMYEKGEKYNILKDI